MQHHELCDQSLSAGDVLSAGSINRLNCISLLKPLCVCLRGANACQGQGLCLARTGSGLNLCAELRGNVSACWMCLCVGSCTKVPASVLLHEKLSGVSDV